MCVCVCIYIYRMEKELSGDVESGVWSPREVPGTQTGEATAGREERGVRENRAPQMKN